MRKKTMAIAVLAIVTMCLATALGAQQSSQNAATAGVYSNDVDNFVNVNYYGDVELGNWFGYVGAGGNGYLGLGYAKNFGGLYLGAYYTGNVLDKVSQSSKTLVTNWDENLQKMTAKEDQDWYGRNTTEPDNSIDLLIGVAGMGFKLGFAESYTFYNAPYNTGRVEWSSKRDELNGYVSYSGNDSISYTQSEGFMAPSFQWGMKIDLGGKKVLAPRLGAAYAFISSELVDEYYDNRTLYNDNIAGAEIINKNGYNNGYNILFGTAGFDFYLDDSMYIGVDYSLQMDMYDQSFDQAGSSGSVEGFIKWESRKSTATFLDRTETESYVGIAAEERSLMSHTIVPALWKEVSSSSDVKFGILLQVPITFGNSTLNTYSKEYTVSEVTYSDASRTNDNEKTTTEKHYAGFKHETSVLEIAPSLGFGATYAVIPGKFTVNAGVKVSPITYTNTSTTVTTNGLDSSYTKKEKGGSTVSEEKEVEIPSARFGGTGIYDSVESSSEITGLRGELGAGFTVNFTDNFMLDVSVGTNSSANVLFTVKY